MDATGAAAEFPLDRRALPHREALHDKNLIVPLSGDFGGPKAIRAVGAYLKKQGGTVSAFYVSNVEQYLFQDGKATAFYENVATLPLTEASVFIRPYSMRRAGGETQSLCAIGPFVAAASAGKLLQQRRAGLRALSSVDRIGSVRRDREVHENRPQR